MNGIDYSYARPGGANIKAKGYQFVCRYLSYSPGKTITADEVTDLHNNGLGIVLVWETTADRALAGRTAGQQDASAALNEANALGFPSSRPIYFAVDFDASPAQQQAINDYFQGCVDHLGVARVGVYGGFYVVQRVLNAGLAHWSWQTLAWSGGQQDPRNHIYQTGGTDFNGGADIDEAKQEDFGQWGGDNMDVIHDADNEFGRWSKTFQEIRGRIPTRAEFQASGVGQTWLHALEILEDDPEADRALVAQETGQKAIAENWEGQINSLNGEIEADKKTIADLNTQVDDLKKQLGSQPVPAPSRPDPLTQLIEWLRSFFGK